MSSCTAMEPPVVDVIIPAYCARDTIAETVNSLLAQSDPRWRAIVVEDGCPDRCAQAVPRDPRVRVFRQDNAGQAIARNTALTHATAPLVYFLDADDIAMPTMVARAAEALRQPADGAPAHGWIGPSVTTDEFMSPIDRPTLVPPRALERSDLLRNNPVPPNALILRRACLLELDGPFDPDCVEDWDLLLSLSSTHPGGHRAWAQLPGHGPVGAYRIRPGSYSSAIQRTWPVTRRMLLKHGAEPEIIARHAAGFLGRAVAWDDRDAAARLIPEAGPLDTDDRRARFAESIRFAVWRDARVHVDALNGEIRRRRPELERRASALGLDPSLLDHPALCATDWGSLLDRARRQAPDPARIAVFGCGTNGRAALRAAHAAGMKPLVADDNAEAVRAMSATPIDPGELGPEHTVVVTPGAHEAILARLFAQGVERVLRPGP